MRQLHTVVMQSVHQGMPWPVNLLWQRLRPLGYYFCTVYRLCMHCCWSLHLPGSWLWQVIG